MTINLPNYFSEASPEKLRARMIEYINLTGLDVKYFDIQFDGKKWVCWFYEKIDTDQLINKEINKANK
jgi:hypothetical protein